VPGAELRQFRDVHGASATTAWLLASGTGDLSRIFRTDDAGATWVQQWVNEEPLGFYDCMDFWDERRGFVYGDAVDGSLRILVTDDGGASWNLVASGSLPQAFPGEGGFAASGTCAIAGEGGRGWIAAALGESTRAFLTTDYGRTWAAAVVPVVSGDGAGLTSISMVDARRGTAFGGNLGITDVHTDNLARTLDGGRTWTALPHASMTGALYGGVHVPDTGLRGMVAVGPGGADVSIDGGERWATLDLRPWWGIGSLGPDATWITGPGGRIARIRMR
jgi:photosystem II stability/assembly factor-like uncharacterized protein